MSNDNYEEVEAIIRLPRGKRLADSKKNDGWSVGFTPKTSDQGPEYVGIKFKNDSRDPLEPTFGEASSGTRENPTEQEEADDVIRYLVIMAMLLALKEGKPFLRKIFEEKIIPFYLRTKNARTKRKTRRAKRKQLVESDAKLAGAALAIQEPSITSDEAKLHFAQALMAQHFANEKMRLLATTRIEDPDLAPKVLERFNKLTRAEAEKALTQLLIDNPNLLSDLATARSAEQLPVLPKVHRSLEG